LKFPEKERELATLQRKYKVLEQTYEFLLQKQAEMSINKASTVSGNRILDRAVLPTKPVKPNIPMILLTSLLLGFIVAMLVAYLREILDDKIKTREDVASNTRIPFYGVIPQVRSADKMFTIEDQQSVASEALRLIRTNLEFIPTENKSKVIVVSSTVPGEGKTTIATNLAAVFGMSDKKCIVISLDMRRPMLPLQSLRSLRERSSKPYVLVPQTSFGSANMSGAPLAGVSGAPSGAPARAPLTSHLSETTEGISDVNRW